MKRPTQIIVALLVILVGAVAYAQDSDAPTTPPAEANAPASGGSSMSEAEISRTTNVVSNEVMSPFCPGKTLAMCPSPAAAEVRRDIQVMASQGDDVETIKRRLIEEYGDEFEIVEPDRFDNAVVFSMIVIGLILCLVVVIFISKRGKGRRDDDDEDGDEGGAGRPPGGSDDDGDRRDGPTLSGAEDGEVDDSYLSALRDEYRS